MERNRTVYIDPDMRDLAFDDEGMMRELYGDETSAQCVRLTLMAWKADFPLDESHGTDYERILGQRISDLTNDSVDEVVREAIFQEETVTQIDSIAHEVDGRHIDIEFSGTLSSGQTISMEVTQT